MMVVLRYATLAMLLSVCELTRAASRCFHPIPGTFKLTLGVDITKLDPFIRDGEDGLTRQLFEFSCAETINLRGKTYQRPMAVIHHTLKEIGVLKNITKVYSTPNEVRHALVAANSVIGSFGDFAFCDSESFIKIQEAIMKDSKLVSDVRDEVLSNEIRLSQAKDLHLMPQAQRVLVNLKGHYRYNPEPYKALIRLYGTHYYSQATLGGLVRTIKKIGASYVMTHDDPEVHTTSETDIYGGDSNLFYKNGFDGWKKFVDEDPYIISCVLKPLSDLVKNTVERNALNEAIRTYVIKSYLENLLKQVQIMEATDYLPPLSEKERLELDNIRRRINDLKTKDPIKEEEEQVAREIGSIFENILKKHVVVPDTTVYQSSSWRSALDDTIRTQVTKAKLKVILQTISHMTRDDYLPPVTEDEIRVLEHIRGDIKTLLDKEIFKYNHEKYASYLSQSVHDITKAHIFIRQSDETGTWQDHVHNQVNTQLQYQSKLFDEKIKEFANITREYVTPPDPKHSGSWQIDVYMLKNKRTNTLATISVAIYGTKGWTNEMQLNNFTLAGSGGILRGSFDTPDIGRPLKLELWLSSQGGTEISEIKLHNGPSMYTLTVNCAVSDVIAGGRTHLELEFP